MADLVYKRVSTDQQSTDRQNLVLAEAGIEDPVVFEDDPETSSRLHPLQRPKFRELLTYARPGDTVHISEMFRLVRGTGHILDVLDVLHRDRLAFSAMDLTAELDDAEQAALDKGQAVRRGTGYILRVTATTAVRRRLLDRCQVLDGVGAIPAQRKARREYENRVNTLG
ncbi:recombinase family protein [Streptomyces sp. BR1]|uniref:recombinase family protein n=1 Tax=Streptomyces sp. BR1 TaxID=1592323 RepID=UPI00402BB22B